MISHIRSLITPLVLIFSLCYICVIQKSLPLLQFIVNYAKDIEVICVKYLLNKCVIATMNGFTI